ncbi:MAG: hypothetical protein IIB83_07480, partial [Bacteroidetes bacterium]|nr:hypothetical protein [Bacteroidota bacterium]
YVDDLVSGIFDVLDKNLLNGSRESLKDKTFRNDLLSLIAHVTDLSQREIPLDEAKGKIKMSLANNRRIVAIFDSVFEKIAVDATAIHFKKSRLISPAMRLRKTLHDAMTFLEKGAK